MINILKKLNILSQDNSISITNTLLYIISYRVITAPFIPNIMDIFLLSVVVLNYIHKRYITYKSERIQTNKELIESLREEFNTYKEESKKKNQEIEDQLTKSRERLIRIEQDYR